MSIFKQYFDITQNYRRDYGDNTILFMQVGGFYEIYGLRNQNNNYLDNYSKIYDICLLSGLKISDKDSVDTIDNCSISMAGFRIYSLEKYLKIAIENGYACVVYDQDDQKTGTTRSLQAVYTPGTYFDNDDTTISNTICCCWIHKFKNIIVIGSSCINVLTGKSYIYEYECLYEISPETFDELERFISTFSPNELLIIHNIPSLEGQTLISLCNITSCIRTSVIDVSDCDSKTPDNDVQQKRVYNCTKQTYQDEIYKRFFESSISKQSNHLLNTYAIASQSYCFLLDYIYQNNPYLISNIEHPLFENKSSRVVLGNHSLKQLNIIQSSMKKSKEQSKYSNSYVEPYTQETKPIKKRYSSICDLLNYCKTSMGNRLFHYTMTHPHNNTKLLNKIYATTEFCKTEMDTTVFNTIVSSLVGMFDIEKIIRKVYINRVSYEDIMRLYETLRETNKIVEIITGEKHQLISNYINFTCHLDINHVNKLIETQLKLLERHFTVSVLSSSCEDYNVNIFKLGIYKEHDKKVIDYYHSLYKMKMLHHYLVNQMKKAEQKKSKTNKMKIYKREPVKLNETDKGNMTFEVTSSRATTLLEYMKRECSEDKTICISDGINSNYHKIIIKEGIIPAYLLDNDEFKTQCFQPVFIDALITFEKATSNGQKVIKNKTINSVLKNTQLLKIELETSVNTHFKQFISVFKDAMGDYEHVAKFCSHIDMLHCYTLVAKNTNYCMPVIHDEEKDSFCEFEGLRHPLIEHLLEDELYVANSIALNHSIVDNFNHAQGFLLYGTNTVGKSSFIKSIGIAVIMAQCGFYVAAETMRYKPYSSIYTRILGNDDLFRGLSTFNVEMIELKNILNYADKNSLVLGDEVCSGTEMGSASSIFMGALEHLYHKNVNYIFATHFHNIVDCEEMISLTKMKNIHLSVRYDKSCDKLLYDRKLKKGAGENMYGLEVCKFLHLPDAFIKRSYEIRNKYFNTATSLLDLKPSKYNANKLVGNCENCGKKGTEVHHLQYQRNSDEKGFIKNAKTSHYFHKNNKSNLMVLCDKCHDKLHKESSSGHYRVSNSYNIIE